MGMMREFFRGIFDDGSSEEYVPQPIQNPSHRPEFPRFCDLLPYLGWDDKKEIFVLEGSEEGKVDGLGFVIEMVPQTGASEDMADLLSVLFRYMPTGTGVQWTLMGSPLIGEFLDHYVGLRHAHLAELPPEEAARKKIYADISERLAEHYKSGANKSIVANQPFLLRDFRLLMSVVVPETDYNDPDVINRVVSLRDTCVTTLKTYYQFKKVWGPDDLINWCSMWLNPQKSILKYELPHLEYDTGRPIKHQIVSPDTVMRVTEDGMIYGLPQHGNEIVARCMSVRSYPKVTTLHQMGALIGDFLQSSIGYTCPFAITLGAMTLDFEETRATTQMRAARSTQKAESPMARFMPELQDIKRDWDIAQRAFDEGSGTVRIYHQLMLWGRPQDMARAEQSAQAVWRAKQFEIVQDTYIQIQGLLASLPMTLTKSMQRDLKVAQRISTKTVINAVNTAPLLAEWHGVGEPVVPLWGRRGQAMGIDLFANTSGNYNGVIIGTSGSGKSVLLNHIALAYLGIGARVWIIDIGRSFEKLCHSVNGQYIEFTQESNICLNPWSMVTTIEEDLEMLLPLFEQMISPNEPLDDYRRRQLGIHIQSVWWDFGRSASIDDLAHSLLNNCEKGGPNPQQATEEWQERVRAMSYEERQSICDPRIRDMGVQLQPFTKDGPYGKYFDGPTNVNFDSDLIVLELEELAAKKDLQTVIMYLLMYRITQNMYLTRDRMKICILDEAWQLLSGGNSSDFIETGYRRARKYFGSFLAATQGVGDFSLSRAAEAAFSNADWLFLMRQKAESILALEKSDKLVMDENMKKMLLSVKTAQGHYSEVFIHAGQMGQGIGRILFDPFALLLVSSKAEDFEAVRKYREAGYSETDAIEEVLADRNVAPYVAKRKQKMEARRGAIQ